MRARLYDGIRATRTWLRARTVRGGLILLYHRIAVPPVDPWRLSVSPAHFAEHLQVLKRRGALFRIRELAAALQRPRTPRRFLAVTFDDGYDDNLRNAKPLLERFDAPATVFVSSGLLGRERPFWWDELQELLLFSSSLPETLTIDTPTGRWEYRTGVDAATGGAAPELPGGWRASANEAPTKRQAAYVAVHAMLSALGPSGCESGMSQLRSQIGRPGGDARQRESGRPLSPEEAVELGRGGLVEIGAHGQSHARLARLSEEEQRREIAGSRRHLEGLLGNRVTSFAYPFGGQQDFTAKTASIVQEEGFSAACAAIRGLVREGADIWQLPRFHVEDCDGDQLDRRISQWLAA
ncbi:MAG: polysaccharide deacetylase family protein [Acidobacteriota bacterium]